MSDTKPTETLASPEIGAPAQKLNVSEPPVAKTYADVVGVPPASEIGGPAQKETVNQNLGGFQNKWAWNFPSLPNETTTPPSSSTTVTTQTTSLPPYEFGKFKFEPPALSGFGSQPKLPNSSGKIDVAAALGPQTSTATTHTGKQDGGLWDLPIGAKKTSGQKRRARRALAKQNSREESTSATSEELPAPPKPAPEKKAKQQQAVKTTKAGNAVVDNWAVDLVSTYKFNNERYLDRFGAFVTPARLAKPMTRADMDFYTTCFFEIVPQADGRKPENRPRKMQNLAPSTANPPQQTPPAQTPAHGTPKPNLPKGKKAKPVANPPPVGPPAPAPVPPAPVAAAPAPPGPPGPPVPNTQGPPAGPPRPPRGPPAPPPGPPAPHPYYPRFLVLPDGRVGVPSKILFSDDQKTAMERYLPGWVPIEDPPLQAHVHPIASFERLVTEAVLYNMVNRDVGPQGAIVDIGGNPDRHQKYQRRNVWCLCPVLTPNDAVKNTSWNSLNWCTHKVQDVCACGAADAYMSVHSLYYLDPIEVLQAIDNCSSNMLYAMVHHFPNPVGTHSLGDVEYRINGKGHALAIAKGNSHTYEHDTLQWLNKQYYTNGVSAMAWSRIQTVGDTHIYKFVRTTATLPRNEAIKPMFIGEALANVSYVGKVNYQPITVMGTAEKQHPLEYEALNDMYSWGSAIIVGADNPVAIPKILLGQVRAAMAYKPRTPETFQSCVAITKTLVRKSNIPEQLMDMAVTYIPLMAFSQTEAEHKGLIRMLLDTIVSRTLYNRAIGFQVNWLHEFIYRHPYLVLLSIVGTGAAAYTWFSNRARLAWQLIVTKAQHWGFISGSSIATLIIKALRWLSSAIQSMCDIGVNLLPRFKAWCMALIQKIIDRLRPGSLVTGILNYIKHERYDDICYEGTPTKPIDPDSRMTTVNLDACKPKHGATACGIVFGQRMPVQARACVHNEAVGLLNRTLFHVPYDAARWQHMHDEFYPEFIKLLPINGTKGDVPNPLPPLPYHVWRTRFPIFRRKAFDAAREEGTMMEQPNYPSRKTFIKREFLFKIDELGPYDMSPRIIQGGHELYQVVTGPWTAAFSKYLASEWSMANESHIIYTSGLNAQQLGEVFDWAIEQIDNQHEQVVIVEDDCVNWDGTQVTPALKFENKVYARFLPPRKTMRSLRQQEITRGRTAHGIKYRTPARRKSGDGQTSCGNTLQNCADHLYALSVAYQEKHGCTFAHAVYKVLKNCIMLMLGDDSLFVTHTNFLKYFVRAEQILRELGLVPKMKMNLDPYLSEYCSGWFWPSSVGHVYGPKMGRILTKGGWSKKPETEPLAWAKAVAMGLKRDTHHIPVLRTIVDKVLELTQHVDATAYIERDPNYFRPHMNVEADPVDETYDFMYKTYGVDRDHIRRCENLIAQIKQLPVRVCSELFTPFFVDMKPRADDATVEHLPPPNPPKVWYLLGSIGWTELIKRLPRTFYITYALALIAPLYEEYLKHIERTCYGVPIGKILTAGIIAFELIEKLWIAPLAAVAYLPTLCMHLYCMRAPRSHAIRFHFGYNLAVLLVSLRWLKNNPPDVDGVFRPKTGAVILPILRLVGMTENVSFTAGSEMPRKARQVINRMIANKQVTPKGVSYLEALTDPFHDTELTIDGMPDMSSARSITQVVTRSYTLSAPTGATWDAHLFFAPMTKPWGRSGHGQQYYRTGMDAFGTLAFVAATTPVHAGWNAIAVPTGDEWPTSSDTDWAGDNIDFPADFSSGTYRLIASGLEVVNTTAALYRGGDVVCYRSPGNSSPINAFVTLTSTATNTSTVSTTVTYSQTGTCTLMPPITATDAALYPNSKTWLADKGCYIIATLNQAEVPYITPLPGFASMVSPLSSVQLNTGTGWAGYFPYWLDPSVMPNAEAQPKEKLFKHKSGGIVKALTMPYGEGWELMSDWVEKSVTLPPVDRQGSLCSSCTTTLPFDINGAIFSGLTPQTTLKVTVRYYIERHPTIADPNLLVLSDPPAPYDPVVMEMAARVMQLMPVGVPVDENPLGEWFNQVIGAVAEWAPKIGEVVGKFIPGASMVGKAIGTMATLNHKIPAQKGQQGHHPVTPSPRQMKSKKQKQAKPNGTRHRRNSQ